MDVISEKIPQRKYCLVIDDQVMCRLVAAAAIRREFKNVECVVDMVSDGAKALEKIAEREKENFFYEVISCDFNLGTEDTGADVIYAIRQLGPPYDSVSIRGVTEQVDDMKKRLQELFKVSSASELPNITIEQKDPAAKIGKKFTLSAPEHFSTTEEVNEQDLRPKTK